MEIILSVLLLFAPLASFSYEIPQTPRVTGSLCSVNDPDFETYRYASQIPYCTRNVSNSLKTKLYKQYDIPKEDRKDYTIDHIIPLSIGGSNHEDNLWPEHKDIKNCRHNLELKLFEELRDDKITQQEAIQTIKKVKFEDICTE